MKYFDLNIDRILENWELPHAIRELISNALDESILTATKLPEIYCDASGNWIIRDYGRGLGYQDLIQSENLEKLSNPGMIGKFGIGLKDALATFDRHGTRVVIRSRHGDITLQRVSKHSFEDIVTLHAAVTPPSFPEMEGTECSLSGVTAEQVETARKQFLAYSSIKPLEETRFGAVYNNSETIGVIYINGMKVSDEPNFLFSYNITSLTITLKKALNRERQNLGRSSYSDRIRAILLASESSDVAQALADDLQEFPMGQSHEELSWLDVQEHAVRILNAKKKMLFVTAEEIISHPDLIDSARSGGFHVLSVPEALSRKIQGATDISGQPINELNQFIIQRNESFEFSWVSPDQLSIEERSVWDFTEDILQLVGGRPAIVAEILISETLQKDAFSSEDTLGLWMPMHRRIVIRRSRLKSLGAYAGTLLHETIHAKHGADDVSRYFEHHLTILCGTLAAQIVDGLHSGGHQTQGATSRDRFYLHQDGNTSGPYGTQEMRHQAATGVLRPDALVCREGDDQWSGILDHDYLKAVLRDPLTAHRHQEELRSLMARLISVDLRTRSVAAKFLSETKVLYRCRGEPNSPIYTTLWQVLDLIDAGILPVDTEICVTGSDYWREAIPLCALMCGIPRFKSADAPTHAEAG